MKNTIFQRALEHLNRDWTSDCATPVFAVKYDDLGRLELQLEAHPVLNYWMITKNSVTLTRYNYAKNWQNGDDFESYDYIETHDFKRYDYETSEALNRATAEKMVEICEKYKLERAF